MEDFKIIEKPWVLVNDELDPKGRSFRVHISVLAVYPERPNWYLKLPLCSAYFGVSGNWRVQKLTWAEHGRMCRRCLQSMRKRNIAIARPDLIEFDSV